jgi:hypothetical protein
MNIRKVHKKTNTLTVLKCQRGQAMTEFVIGAAFVLVPLFLFTSIAGKYADMKYAGVQAARYEAWEYTANYLNTGDVASGFNAISNSNLPVKSITRVQRESQRRFFSDTTIALNSRTDRGGYLASDENPLWAYHDGTRMYDPLVAAPLSSARADNNTPDPTNIITTTIDIFDTVFSAFGSIISALGGNVTFDVMNSEGYATSTVSIPIVRPPTYGYTIDQGSTNTNALQINQTRFINAARQITFEAKAAVLTDSWSSGGTDQTLSQAGGLVPTNLLDVLLNPGGFPLQDIASTLLLSPELSRSNLRFGHMVDLIPAEKVNGGTHSCTDGGYCEQ